MTEVRSEAKTGINNGPTPIISLRRATKTFGFDDSATDAITSINLEIQKGRICCHYGTEWLR